MKRLKNGLLITLVCALAFVLNVKADTTGDALQITGTGVTTNGGTSTMTAKAGDKITISLVVKTDKSVDGLTTPWNYNSIKDKITLVSSKSTYTSSISDNASEPDDETLIVTYPANAVIDSSMGFMTTTAKSPSNGVVKIIDLTFQIKSGLANETNIVLSIGEGTNPAPALSHPDVTEAVTPTAAKLTITINNSSDGGNNNGNNGGNDNGGNNSTTGTDLGYGITMPATEAETSTETAKGSTGGSTSDTATIKIGKVSDGAKCYVYRSTSKDSGYELITKEAIDCSKDTEFKDTGLKAGTTYYYRIRVVGSKKISDPIEITTAAASSGGEASKDSKNGDVSGKTDTGVAIPIIAIAALSGSFIVLKKYGIRNKLFNRI